MTEIIIKGQIQSREDAQKIFNEVLSVIEKQYETMSGSFTVIFENSLGIGHKFLKEGCTTQNAKI